jgi:hypothetical protein
MRRLVLGLAAAAALAASSAAGATTYIGSTTGCFGAACSPTLTTDSSGGLVFHQGTFNQADSDGFLSIGSGMPPTDTFGTFDLSFPFTSPQLFTLLISFTNPTGAVGADHFSATITGSVSINGSGGVTVNFDNTDHLFTSNAGPFFVTLNDIDVSNGALGAPITGHITAVPEPAAWGMMLLGFAGIGMTLRTRRRPALAQLA